MDTFTTTLKRIGYIDFLIRLKATGTPSQLAKKLNISVSHTYNLIRQMKEMGAPVCFDRNRNTYYYYEPCCINVILEEFLKLN